MKSDPSKDWRTVALGDIAEVVGGGTPSTKHPENFGGEVPWITPKDLAGHMTREIAHGTRNLTEKGLTSSAARLLPKGSILLSTRAPIGYVAIASQPVSTNQGFRSLILTEGHIPEFYYYLLKASTNVLESRAGGSTFRELSGSALRSIEFLVPPCDEQERIARVLSSIDDKIESNHRLASALEEVTAALFKARFADFVGHDDLAESEIGPIPRGWSTKPVGDLARYVNGKAFTKFGNGRGRMVIRIAELRSGAGGSTVYSDHEAEPDFMAMPGDILFAWSGSLDVYRWHGPEALINQHIFKVTPKGYPAWLVFHALKYVMPHFQAIAADKATTMGHIKRADLQAFSMAIPPASDLKEHDAVLAPLFARSFAARKESETLAAIRDTLLPRLISGRLRIHPDAELAPEAA